jgi:hypothetical protein
MLIRQPHSARLSYQFPAYGLLYQANPVFFSYPCILKFFTLLCHKMPINF